MTDKVADLIASSTTFQTLVSEASEAAAKNHVYQIAAEQADMARPCAVVWLPDNEQVGRGGYGNGDLQIHFESAVLASAADATAGESFRATCRNIVQEMMTESANGGRLLLRSIVLSDPIARMRHGQTTAAGAQAQFFLVAYRVPFGPERVP